MRRTGAVEAQSGGADLSVISQKMANTVASCQQLQKTYLPVNMAALEEADQTRKRGRRRIHENNSAPKVDSRPRKVETARPFRANHLKKWRG
jgi:hypothetical protein